jgi:hypothetical protein
MIETLIPRDRQQPRRELRSLGIERFQFPKHRDKHLLYEVFHIRGISHHVSHKPKHTPLMPLNQLPKRFHVPGQNPLNQCSSFIHPILPSRIFRPTESYTAKLSKGSVIFLSSWHKTAYQTEFVSS